MQTSYSPMKVLPETVGVAILTAYGIQYLAYIAASSAAVGVGVGITALLLFFCITGE